MSFRTRFVALFSAGTMAAALVAGPATADTQQPFSLLDPPLQQSLLASATPDECFGGIGVDYAPLQTAPDGTVSCPGGQQLKVNQAYVWGMAKSAGRLWFGTGPNINCLATAQFIGPIEMTTDSFTCEGSAARHLTDPFFADLKSELIAKGLTGQQADDFVGGLGDWRASNLFTYDLTTKALVRLDDQVTGDGAALLARTVGIRSAGAIGDTVIFAGPDVASMPNGGFGAVNFFVFKGGRYLGAESVPGWTNIRKWVEIDGSLYTGVATVPEAGNSTRGEVVKFLGADAADVVQTQVVGQMTTAPSEFTKHGNRVYTSTWPVGENSDPAGIWVSPALGEDGLTATDAGTWREVWNIADYEPDPLVQASTAIGPVESLDGALFWGTMNIPFVGAFQHGAAYADKYGHRPSAAEIVAMLAGAHRATSLFRARDLTGPAPRVDLLYGDERLPVATYADTEPVIGSPVKWALTNNRMGGRSPLYGPAGFGNPFNAYTWTMAVNRGELYVGTFDDSYLISSMMRALVDGLKPASGMLTAKTVGGLLTALGMPADGSNLPLQYGADLYRFSDSRSRAWPVFVDGSDNRYSYGIRTIVDDGQRGIYLGMANPMNLEVNPKGNPQGGWQLVQVAPSPTTTTITGNPIAEGSLARLRVGVTGEGGTPTGRIRVFDGGVEVGSCLITRLNETCPVLVNGLAAGTHSLTARYVGAHAWASSSATLNLVVSGPTPTPDPTVTPTPKPPEPSVSARRAGRAVKAEQTTVLVRRATSGAKVTMRCTAKTKPMTGKAARKACGMSIERPGGGLQVWAKPTCRATRIGVTLRWSGKTWSRSWPVARRTC